MRYKAGYKEEKRRDILKTSGELAKKQGFNNTGVDGFMHAANMTSGAFYSHFSSKNDLFKALIESEIGASIQQWEMNPHQDPESWLDFEMNRYLSLLHVQHPEKGCVLPSLAAEVSRADADIKQCFENELQRGYKLFAQHAPEPDFAWAILCQMVGSVLLARGVQDERLKKDILNSSLAMLKTLLKNGIAK